MDAFFCDAVRTPIGRYGGALSSVRTDDLAALPLQALQTRNPDMDWSAVEDVLLGCANQAGEDNRNIARMAALLAGLPQSISGATINRLCGSGMDAIGTAARAIRSGEAELLLAGGVESMSRAPFVMGKTTEAFSRNAEVFDSTLGWRFVNPLMQKQYGIDSMPETGENVAEQFGISREDQDAFAWRSQQKAGAAMASGRLAEEIVSVTIPQRKGDPVVVEQDEHPRPDTKLEKLAKLSTPFRANGTVTAGNASQMSDGAAAVVVMSSAKAEELGLRPRLVLRSYNVSGVAPEIMGIGPVEAVPRALEQAGLTLDDMDVIELNEAFAVQALSVIRELDLPMEKVNVNGGAVALGHPLGCTGARMTLTALGELERREARYALVTMCIGGGMGAAGVFERI